MLFWSNFTDCAGRYIRRYDLIILFLIALALRFVHLDMMVDQIGTERLLSLAPDTTRYVNIGLGFASFKIIDEFALLIFGPGYGAFLGICFLLFGQHPLPIIIIQIILSSLGCVLLYKLGKELTNSKAVGYLAGLLGATSFTSISLSNYILSDTLFFFLFLLGNLLFLIGLKENEKKYFITSGVVIGAAIMVRSIGQFWPLMMLAFIFILPIENEIKWNFRNRVKLLKLAHWAPLIALIIVSLWLGRNYFYHDTAMMTTASSGGPANIAAMVQSKVENREIGEVRAKWVSDYQKKTGATELSQVDFYHLHKEASREVFFKYPKPFLSQYADLIWENVNALNELHRSQLPDLWVPIVEAQRFMIETFGRYGSLYYSGFGLLLLVLFRRYRAAIFLGSLFIYFALLIGVTQWQGSRLFYPGQIAWSVLIAFFLVSLAKLLGMILIYAKVKFETLTSFGKILKARAWQQIGRLEFINRFCNPDRYRGYFIFFCVAVGCGLVVLYRKFIFANAVLAGSDMLEAGYFFRYYLVDHVWQFGSIPKWNNLIYCGLPYIDAFHGDIFYPLSFLKYFGSIFRSIGYTLILHVWLAGIFAFMTARQLKLSKLAATMVGVAYMFSGWLNGQIAAGNDGKMYVTALFPLLIYFSDRGFEKNRFLNFSLLGVVIGFIILTPHVQLAYFSLWVLALYTIYKLVAMYSRSRKLSQLISPGTLTVYAVVIGVALSAIQMYPGYLYTQNDSLRSGYTKKYSFSTSWSLHQEEAISMIVPEFCGFDDMKKRDMKYWGRNPFKDNSEYAGLIPLLIGIVGLIYYRGRKKYFFGALAFGSLIYGLGDHTPFFKLCYKYIPLVRSTRAPSMISFLFSFAVSILAGMGLQALLDRRAEGNLNWPKLGTIILSSFSILLLIGALAYTFKPEGTHYYYLKYLSTDLFGNEQKFEIARKNFGYMAIGFWVAFLWSVLVSIIVRFSSLRKIGYSLILLLPLVAMIDGIRFSDRFIRTVDYKTEYAYSPMFQFLNENRGDYRVCGYTMNEGTMHMYYHGIPNFTGGHGNQLSEYNEALYYGGGKQKMYRNHRFTSLAGTKYIMIWYSTDISSMDYGEGNLELVADFGRYRVVENKLCFPRTYLVGQYQVIPDLDSINYLICYGTDDLRDVIYTNREPGIIIDTSFAPGDTAWIDYYSTDSILIQASCATAKILTLSDNYYKDWHVYVDGVEKDILRTYGLFRGVALEAGDHEVVYKYIPANYLFGRSVTLAAMGYLFFAFGFVGFRNRKQLTSKIKAVIFKYFSAKKKLDTT